MVSRFEVQDRLVQTVNNMTDQLARRGPDAQGMAGWPGAVLGHRRLSIIDLSAAGNQPMLSPDGSVGVTFNGAIYNFRELRSTLEQSGYQFCSQCDTEVLVHGYLKWGIDGLAKQLHGMFAFAIWDNRVRRLYLVRDRLGVKPLVYTSLPSGDLAFASTASALSSAGFGDGVDSAAVLEFLDFGWVSEERSIFGAVQKLQPGTILEWQDGSHSIRSYWTMPEPASRQMGFEDAVAHTEELLLDAVRMRLTADVPVAALLSSGIDSTLVCWALAKAGRNVQTFTVGTPGDPSDESAYAVQTARMLDIPHEVVPMHSGSTPQLELLGSAFGEPFGCTSALGMLRVCDSVRSHAKVLLTGDGGDDAFLGYPHYRRLLYAQRLSHMVPEPLTRPVCRSLGSVATHAGPLRRAWRFLDYATGGLGAVTQAHDGLPWYRSNDLLGERLRSLESPHRLIPRNTGGGHTLLADYLRYERRNRFVSEYLNKVDGASMYWSIEARSPFLDQKLWEFAAALPFPVHFQGGQLKAVLREIVRRRLGPEVATRRKQGFVIPVERWIATHQPKEVTELGDDSVLERDGWLRRGAIRDSLASAAAQGTARQQLWWMLVLESWMRKQPRRFTAPSGGSGRYPLPATAAQCSAAPQLA